MLPRHHASQTLQDVIAGESLRTNIGAVVMLPVDGALLLGAATLSCAPTAGDNRPDVISVAAQTDRSFTTWEIEIRRIARKPGHCDNNATASMATADQRYVAGSI